MRVFCFVCWLIVLGCYGCLLVDCCLIVVVCVWVFGLFIAYTDLCLGGYCCCFLNCGLVYGAFAGVVWMLFACRIV